MTPDPVPLHARAGAAAGSDLQPRRRPSRPAQAPMRAVPPTRRIKVLQFGPALDVRGGITTVEQHICDYLAPYVSIRHIATMDQGSKLGRALVFARAVRSLRRALEGIEPYIVHIHFASRGSTLRKMILAEHGDACRTAAGAACAWRLLRPVPSPPARIPATHRRLHPATRECADCAVAALARFLRQRVRAVAVAGGGVAESGALELPKCRIAPGAATCNSCFSVACARRRAPTIW